MWTKTKERESSPANYGHIYLIDDKRVAIIKEYDNIIEAFVYRPDGRCANIKKPVSGNNLDVIKLECLVMASELGWNIKKLN